MCRSYFWWKQSRTLLSCTLWTWPLYFVFSPKGHTNNLSPGSTDGRFSATPGTWQVNKNEERHKSLLIKSILQVTMLLIQITTIFFFLHAINTFSPYCTTTCSQKNTMAIIPAVWKMMHFQGIIVIFYNNCLNLIICLVFVLIVMHIWNYVKETRGTCQDIRTSVKLKQHNCHWCSLQCDNVFQWNALIF